MTFSPDGIRRLEVTGSTNDWLKERLLAGAYGWMAVSAKQQTAGRGRYSRNWLSPEGGLYLSVARPIDAPLFPIHIPIAVSVAVCEYLRRAFAVPAVLQWPNDILANGCKLAGVLSELVVMPDGRKSAIVGVGLNVNAAISPLDGRRAISLSQLTGTGYDLDALTSGILGAIQSAWIDLDIHGPEGMIDRWRGLCETIGSHVDVATAEGKLTGLCVGIGPDFSLILETENGRVELVEGDVQRLRPAVANENHGDRR